MRFSALQKVSGSRILSFAITLLAIIFVYAPLLNPNSHMSGFDKLAYTTPNFVSVLTSYSQGVYPLWNTTQFLGSPLLGNMQAGAMYPFRLIGLATGAASAIDLLTFLHLLILLMGLWLLLEGNLRLAPFSGAIAVFVVLGTSAFAIKVWQFEQLLVLAWLPWLLITTDYCLKTRHKFAATASLAIILSLFVTAGHPQMVAFSIPLVSAWIIGRAWDLNSWRNIYRIVIGGVIAIFVSAPQLIATISTASLMAKSDRASASYEQYSLNPQRLPSEFIAFPPVTGLEVPSAGFETLLGLSIIASIFLAVTPLVIVKSAHFKATTSAILIVTISSTVLALGSYLPFFTFALEAIPGFSSSRVPARWLIFVVLGASLLVAFVYNALQSLEDLSGQNAAIGLGLFVAAILGLFVIAPGYRSFPAVATVIISTALALTLFFVIPHQKGIAIFVILTFLSINIYATKTSLPISFTSNKQMVSPVTDFLIANPGPVLSLAEDRLSDSYYLQSTLRPNANSNIGIISLDGYDGGLLIAENWVSAGQKLKDEEFNIDLTMRSQIDRPVNANELGKLGVRWVLIDETTLGAKEQLDGFQASSFEYGLISIYENPNWKGFAFTEDMRDGGIERVSVGPYGEIGTSSSFEFSIEAKSDTRLVLAQRFDPGWVASIDGVSVNVMPYEDFMTSIDVPQGPHLVKISYEPAWFMPSMILQIVGIFLVLIVVFLHIREKNKLAIPSV